MKKQSGFTLIELAIVLVIIGLLLGGVLKGQELINSAKVKSFASDFRNIPVYLYGYQDKFKSIPGDDSAAVAHVGAASTDKGDGDGQLEGRWNDAPAVSSETSMFWEHVRLAGLAPGATSLSAADYYPKNADGGNIGIEAGRTSSEAIAGMRGTFVICSTGILGKYVKQLDLTMDNGDTATGAMMATPASSYTVGSAATATASIADGTSYIVCFAI
ncbi:MAG TPA: prepilin-type N-terminal cleavage/methylation domain-containing protein [Methylophilaceae bacterium]|nr:prepilin-type N-terminal cleavage/methylation domain-containing protein [Methylophilaceae bacterium]